MTTASRTAAAATALAVLLAIAGCAPGASAPTDPPPSASSSPSATAADPTPDPEPTELGAAERQAVVAAVEAGDASALAAAMSDPVDYILASSECCGPLAPGDAAAELVGYTSTETGWTSPADPAFVEQVRASVYYADYVPADVISMRSSGALVVIMGLTGTRVTSVLVGDETVLLF